MGGEYDVCGRVVEMGDDIRGGYTRIDGRVGGDVECCDVVVVDGVSDDGKGIEVVLIFRTRADDI